MRVYAPNVAQRKQRNIWLHWHKNSQKHEKDAFFEKKYQNIWSYQKKAVPLHPLLRFLLNARGAIAQLVEQRTENPCVPGSIPGGTTKKTLRFLKVFFFALGYTSSHN